MSNKYLGTESGLIGPVPENVIESKPDFRDYDQGGQYHNAYVTWFNKYLSSFTPIPCEGWVPESGREYVKGKDFKILRKADKVRLENGKEVITPGERFAVPIPQGEAALAFEIANTADKPFLIDTFRALLNQYDNEEISLSKMVEELNLTAYKWREQSPSPEGWVRVEDGLPDPGHYIVAYYNPSDSYKKLYVITLWRGRFGWNYDHVEKEPAEDETLKVAYYQPLPKPPKQ